MCPFLFHASNVVHREKIETLFLSVLILNNPHCILNMTVQTRAQAKKVVNVNDDNITMRQTNRDQDAQMRATLLNLHADIYEQTKLIETLKKVRYLKVVQYRNTCFEREKSGETNNCDYCNLADGRGRPAMNQEVTIHNVGFDYDVHRDNKLILYRCVKCDRPCLERRYHAYHHM